MSTTSVRELGYLVLTMSSLHIIASDLDVRDHCYDVRSTNILVLLVLAAPIGEDTQTFYNLKNFADFLNVCSANWFAAPIYWRSTRRIKMFAAPHLFGQTMPIQSAGVSEVEIDLFQDGGQIKIKMKVAHHNGS